MAPPGPVKIGHKKDGHQRRPRRFHVSRPPLPGRWIRYWSPPHTPTATLLVGGGGILGQQNFAMPQS